jgi:hydrogenase expression/formation protein HypC
MCLAIPMQLVDRSEHEGVVELKGVRRRVSLMLMPEARVGDHLLIHAGYAIASVDADEAAETVRLFEELIAAEGSGEEEGAVGRGARHGDAESARDPGSPEDRSRDR